MYVYVVLNNYGRGEIGYPVFIASTGKKAKDYIKKNATELNNCLEITKYKVDKEYPW